MKAKPDGLLLHENMILSLFPPHVGIRQSWRDFQSLETWARSEPHRAWWRHFLRDSGGTRFWHETYFWAEALRRTMTTCLNHWARLHLPRRTKREASCSVPPSV